ncbi:TPA: hypothetical protein UON69_003559 [Clostridioides difficile]|nr:hypothetical protein [Clostridioides difficile]
MNMCKIKTLREKCSLIDDKVEFSGEYKTFPGFVGSKLLECECNKNYICKIQIMTANSNCPLFKKARQLQY